ncbi:Molybdopterin-synthase adenylyltransferase [Anaerohalosphaera lusitana]|uniref:Molybdopterin-synthase adenylyltransferase n=1 Tax=Anaerohalosphaera lusitana TaxID=1936003 RepID=A0A1U9NQV2_9BACT|nr:tRNA threonylcarbamoyladenosine dehydratase [Anaerohalosphaera lusitana]AQT70303.1 Molybdopterin-synthase adenylyltransferase [Anaerohalosphaera lusitana]
MTQQNFHKRFARTARLVGPEGVKRLSSAHVAVIGLGAVGSYAVEALTRAGVGNLTLVDFDQITHSNMNRQLYALESTLGQPKSEIARRRVLDINPDCNVRALHTFIHHDTVRSVLEPRPDIVIDAIDSLNPKVELLTALHELAIPTVTSMGAALRTDPSAIRVAKLKKSYNCPLARLVRKRLRRRNIPLDFTCVYSTETTDNLPDHAIGSDRADEHDHSFRGRQRSTLGSLPTITGIFGLTAANTAIKMLAGETAQREPKARKTG